MKFLQIFLGFSLFSIGLTACGAAAPVPPPPTATAVSLLTPSETTQEAAPAAQVEPTSAPTVEPTGAAAVAAASAATVPPAPTSSPTPLPTATLQPTATNTPQPTATSTLVPTFTPVPSPTPIPSPTPEPAPAVSVPPDSGTKINVRSGPGTDYPVLGQMEPGQSALLTGRNQDNSWWQISLADNSLGWVFGQLVQATGATAAIPVAEAPPPPPTATPQAEAKAEEGNQSEQTDNEPQTPQELEDQLRCGQDFCITYQAMVPIWENGGCIGNHSIFITVLQGPPPGTPMSGVVIGDTFNNVEVASGDKGPGAAEITLWMNSMSVKVKRHIDGTPFTSEESFNFTSHDELIPAEVLAANGYCDGSVEKCRWAQQNNQICRGHYSYRVTFHKFD